MYADDEQLVVPFKPPYSIESRVNVITTDFFAANDLFGNSRREYKNAEFFAIQMKRIGLDLQHFVDGEWSNIDTLKRSFQGVMQIQQAKYMLMQLPRQMRLLPLLSKRLFR